MQAWGGATDTAGYLQPVNARILQQMSGRVLAVGTMQNIQCVCLAASCCHAHLTRISILPV